MTARLDRLSRPLRDLRVSVTDRCNLRCPYCMPREVFGREFRFMANGELLSFNEIQRVCRVFASLGVDKIRLTGGEPLLRRELERLVSMIAEVEGVAEIALTTNGTLLAAKATALRDAGLGRVTVSLDSLEEQVFRSMSDTTVPLARILAGIDAAREAGLSPIKINMLVRRGVNEHCLLPMAEHFRQRSEILRFIEYMDVGSTNGWRFDEVVPAAEILAAIETRWPLESLAPKHVGEVASRYRYRDGGGEIGFIHSVSQPFCGDCTRARLSADGKLYTCLFARRGHDLRALLRGGADDRELTARICAVWSTRSDRYSAERSFLRSRDAGRGSVTAAAGGYAHGPNADSEPARVEMSYIGG